MAPGSVLFLLLLALLLLIGAALGVVAYIASRDLQARLGAFRPNELVARIYQLERQLAELQKRVSSAPFAGIPPTPPQPVTPHQTPVPAPPPAPVSAPPPRPAVAPPPIPHAAPKISHPVRVETKPTDLEAVIGGRWFNRIGIIALLLAVSYFLKLAFDNNWIGPPGRVAIGILLGLLMLPWSQWLLGRGYTYFSDGIAGLGEATLFVSIWAGCQYYALFSREIGFGALVAVTAMMAALALWRNSERIAFLSILGGILAPALVSSGKNEQLVLFSYLLCLGIAAALIAWRKEWQTLLPLTLLGTQFYFWDWYQTFYSRAGFLESTVFFATLFFVLYSIIPVLRTLRQLRLRPLDILLVLANAFVYTCALYALLWPQNRSVLALFFLALAAVHSYAAYSFFESESKENSLARNLYVGMAVTFFTLAIPAQFEGNVLNVVFSLEGVALAWAGFRSRARLLRLAGYFLLGLAAFRLLVDPPPAGTFLLNERFFSYLFLVVCLGFALWAAQAYSDSARESWQAESISINVALNTFALIALSLEFWDFYGHRGPRFDHPLAQNLSLSVLWTFYAALLLLLGLRRSSAVLRWQALVLLGAVVTKVFLYDLSFLDRVYRVLSFLILGAVLLAVSFLYQRKLRRENSGSS
jgi:uncharacterized membrane protein